MAYLDDETSVDASRPMELYEFAGTFEAYYLTSYAQPVTSGGRVYEPVTISRNALKVATQNKKENALEVTLPFDHPMIIQYAYQNAPPNLIFTLRRAHESNPDDTVNLWKGRVTSFSVEGVTAKVISPTLFSYLIQGNTPAPRFQAPCNHLLYDERCGVDPALHSNTTDIVNIQGNVIQVTSSVFADGEAVGGEMISNGGERRMVVSNTGTSITLSYPFAGLEIGDTVTVRKGCNHALEGDCINRFNNGARFGGFPLVPDNNPFTGGIT